MRKIFITLKLAIIIEMRSFRAMAERIRSFNKAFQELKKQCQTVRSTYMHQDIRTVSFAMHALAEIKNISEF